jgi:death on curing protein
VSEPKWLTVNLIISIHDEQLGEFGGPAGIRDMGALESALGRARNRWPYEGGDLSTLAAAYGFGIARNHPFVDGNKRTALLGIIAFLAVNDFELTASEADAVVMIRELAAGAVNEDVLARWIADNMSPVQES